MAERGESLTVGVSQKAIVIRLPLSILPLVLQGAPFNDRGDGAREPRFRVTDPMAFAEAVCDVLKREEEDGTTPVHLLLDRAMEDALEDGREGVQEVLLPEEPEEVPRV